MDRTPLEIVKLECRILILQGILAKTYVAAFCLLSGETKQVIERQLLQEFDRVKEHKYAFLSAIGIPDDQRFFFADEYEELVEDMKTCVESLFSRQHTDERPDA